MTRQKLPDQSSKLFRDDIEKALGIKVDADRVFAFMNQALSKPYQSPSQEDTQAAAAFLFELAQAAKSGEDWNRLKERIGLTKQTGKAFRPEDVTMDSPAFSIVLAYVRGEISYSETNALLARDVLPRGVRTTEKWISIIKPKVEDAIAKFPNLGNEKK